MDDAMMLVRHAERERDAKFATYRALQNSMLESLAAEGHGSPELGDEINAAFMQSPKLRDTRNGR